MPNQMKLIANCQYCNSQFFPLRKSRKYCSEACKQASYRGRLKEKESCKLYTIGYQGRSLPEFIHCLKENEVKHLLDVRYSTVSRFKSEFGEDALRYVLECSGITYISDKRLGVPFEVQDPYKKGKMPIQEFEKLYLEHISSIDINELAKKIKASGRTALMCFEKYATATKSQKIDCHRSILANVLNETGDFDTIIHL